MVLDVRTVADARTAYRYQTAAKTSRLALYVDSEAAREQLLAFVAQTPMPLAVPVAETPGDWWEAALPSPPPPTHHSSTDVNQLIDESFQALAAAQAAMSGGHSERHRLLDALADYSAADRGFEQATLLVQDERTRELFRDQRGAIQRVIRSIESALQAVPSHSDGTGLAFPVIPEPDEPSSLIDNSEATAPVASDLDERLERLKAFAAQQEATRAQREHKPVAVDLRVRLQALRGERPEPVAMATLEQRFQRLRGLGDGLSPASLASDDARTGARMSAVDRLVQQVQEEVALGIPDDDLSDDADDDSSDGSDSSERDLSSSDDDTDAKDSQQRVS